MGAAPWLGFEPIVCAGGAAGFEPTGHPLIPAIGAACDEGGEVSLVCVRKPVAVSVVGAISDRADVALVADTVSVAVARAGPARAAGTGIPGMGWGLLASLPAASQQQPDDPKADAPGNHAGSLAPCAK